ncbi:MAG TPA: phage tail tape measure C-terminal domain-containing protein, partial [Candidatus Cybelea sp.]|nr:phage tail tape measure C-terminal domain-containing protein [Candidatus Cybelea sp.]
SLADIQATGQARVAADVKKYALDDAEAEKARAKSLMDSQKAYEAMLVAASRTPELTRYALDSANAYKQLDTFLVSAFSGFESALGSVANGTTKLADAFKNMTNSIISDLVRMSLRMSITGPLANAISGMFGVGGPFASATTLAGSTNAGWSAPLSSGTFLARQTGGPVSTGRPYVVGEHGPELFVPGSSGQIVPSSVNKTTASGGASVVINNYMGADAQVSQRQGGSNIDGEQYIIDIVRKAQSRGDLDNSNRTRFALRPAKVR